MDRKEMLRQYRESPRPTGVFWVRNTVDDKVLIAKSTDLPGLLNRHRFELEMGTHRDRELQADWNRLGADAFAFEVLDEIEISSEPGSDLKEDLNTLLEMWLAKAEAARRYLYPSARSRA